MLRMGKLLTGLSVLAVAGAQMLAVSPSVIAQDATPVGDAAMASPAQPGGTLPGDPQIQLVKVAEGLADPVNVAAPDDGSGKSVV